MGLTPASRPPAAVVDACLIIGFCAREADKYDAAKAKLEHYAVNGWQLFAPGVLVAEVLYVLCGKLKKGDVTAAEHAQAVQDFADLMSNINPPPKGDASLVPRAEQIRSNYGCSRANDSLYIALAEQLATYGNSEVVTFDQAMKKQAKDTASTVEVELLAVAKPSQPPHDTSAASPPTP